MLSTFIPLAVVVLVTLGSRAVPWRRLPPRKALWALTLIAAGAAATVVVAIAVLAGGFVWATPVGAWLVEACSALAGHPAVPAALGAVAMVLLVMMAWRVGAVVASDRAQRPGGTDPLTVVGADAPIAFARSGRRGGVVVSTGMLRALEPAERRVLFAHERAHVRARHDVHLLVHHLAAAVLPWLARLEPEVCLAAERAADAAALAEVRGDRRLVATAIARAAIATDRYGTSTSTSAFVGGAVAYRVERMLDPGGGAPWPTSATGTLAALGALAASVFVHHLATLLAHLCW